MLLDGEEIWIQICLRRSLDGGEASQEGFWTPRWQNPSWLAIESLTILSHSLAGLFKQKHSKYKLIILVHGWVKSPPSPPPHDREVITSPYAEEGTSFVNGCLGAAAAAVYSAICVPTSHTLRDVFLAQYQRYSSLFNCWGLGCQFLPQHLSAS